MKTLEQIFEPERAIADIVSDLKYYKDKVMTIQPWEELKKEYEPKLHKIMDPSIFPDKPIKDDKGNTIKIEKVTRVAIGLQKLAAKRMSEFLFTIPVKLVAEDTDDPITKDQLKAVNKVLKKNKWNSSNKNRGKVISSECECATIWYVVPADNNNYGFKSKFKLKHLVLSPTKGDMLYPTFDDTGDMIAFSREFTKKEGNKSITIFETWTKDEHIIYQRDDKGWTELFDKLNEDGTGIREKLTIGKIPVVYTPRLSGPVWADADSGKVHEMELLLSRNGDTIAYHSAPVLFFTGKVTGAPTKGESNKVFFGETGADGKYVSWQQAPEAVKFQFESLLKMYFMELQLPDLSFESLKGIGALSSLAIEMLLSDAHLKVGDESEIYEEMFEREFSIIKAFLGEMNTKWKESIKELEIEPMITPFMINDRKTMVETLVVANGNKPVMSQKTSVKLAGLVENADEEYEQIKSESVQDLGNSFE